MKKILLVLPLVAIAVYLLLPRIDASQREGVIALPSLQAEVRVLRGDDGVPYVYAESLDDALVAQGFLHAQDRLFQLELYKYVAYGRLAEFIGEHGLRNDRIVRLLDIAGFARAQLARISPAERNFLQRYLDGVNDYIATRHNEFPLMLAVMGHEPQAWTLEDLVAIQYFRIWTSSVNWQQELLTLQLIDSLGEERARSLRPLTVNPEDPATESDEAGLAGPALQLEFDDSLFSPFQVRYAMGSDAWATDARKSAGSAPILSSDPHLDARNLPGFWYPMGIFTPELRVVGTSNPGGPGFGIGRNRFIAWGATNGYSDMVDLFIETSDPGNPDNYLEGERSKPFATRSEELLIRDSEAEGGYRSEIMQIRETDRGPVISDHGMSVVDGLQLSLRWSVPEFALPDAGNLELLLAHSTDEAIAAIGNIATPLNYIVADIYGNVARIASGLVPIRLQGDGLVPQLVGEQDNWAGRIPPEQMPLQLNPGKGWVGSTNNRVTTQDYPYAYSTHFSGDWRYRRVMEIMEKDQLDAADHWAANQDIKNLLAARMRPTLVAVFAEDAALQPLATVLADWNLEDAEDAAAPLIFQAVLRQLALETFADDMDQDLLQDYLAQPYYWQQRFLSWFESGDSDWFDDSRTDTVEGRDDIIRRAGLQALAELQRDWGNDPAAWRWGDAHTVTFAHPFIPGETAARWIGGGTHPLSGSGETLKRGVYDFNEPYEARIIDSLRMIVDLSDDEKVLAHFPGGASERWFSPWNKNFLDPYLSGDMRYWWFSDAAIAANTDYELVLQPEQGEPRGR